MVTSMLEKAIEIEGLLRIIRDGNPLPETYKLLNRKTAELAEETTGLDVKTERIIVEAPEVDFVMTSPKSIQAQPEVVFAVQDEAASGSIPEDLELDEEDDIILSFEDSGEEMRDSIIIKEEATPTAEKTEEEDPDTNTADAVEADTFTLAAMNEDEKTIPTTVVAKRQGKLKSAFSLNDRFLYARELFGGNMKAFDSALDKIEAIDDNPTIEEYFYNELGWDREDANVASFMEILRR